MINDQKANTWSFFKQQKLTSSLFVGERRHIIWDTEETHIPKSCRAENTERKEKASPLNEFALRGLWASLNEIPKAGDLSMKKGIITNLGLIGNKTCIFPSTCYKSPMTRGKREKKDSTKSQVIEHTIEVYSNFSCCIHADMNKRRIMGRKNSSDKIKKKRRWEYSPIDKLLILNSGSVIKSQSLKESGPYQQLTNCIFTFHHLEEFFALGFYLNCFCFFLFLFLFHSFIQ